MKRILNALLVVTAATAATGATAASYCRWDPGFGPDPMIMTRVLPTVSVPHNAPVGTILGQGDAYAWTGSANYQILRCRNEGDVTMNFDMSSLAPIYPGTLPPIGPDDPNGHVLQTNVRGVGVMIRVGAPFNGVARNEFIPVDRSTRPLVPFKAFKSDDTQLGITVGGMHNNATLIKIGDIDPGVHQIDLPLFQGYLDYDNIGLTLRYFLRGTVIQPGCSIIGDPVSANPVQLGEWEVADFTGVGFGTTQVPFHITLSACQTDPGGMARASIEVHGVNGSQPIGAATAGVFSLTRDSTAEGMGIQVLRDDGSPLPLETEVPLVPLANGTTVLKFAARFYQTEPSRDVRPGVAKGALSFTIRYN